MFRCAYFGLLFVLLAFAAPATAQVQAAASAAQEQTQAPAQIPVAQTTRRPASNNYAVQPLDRILPAIRSSRAGRFFDAEGPFPDAAGGWHYRIKWLTPEGRIVWLDADARTGKVLGPYRGYAGMMLPPAGLRYYPVLPGPRGFRGRFGGWRGGWRGGWGPGRHRR
jgi:hypothetical protein